MEYGDFIAKAILYDHLTKRKGLSAEAAMGQITEEFVNYDRMPGRFRGYMEGIGMLWFWSYKIRSVKVALRAMQWTRMSAPMEFWRAQHQGECVTT